jgi:excinuclease ABC subunit A
MSIADQRYIEVHGARTHCLKNIDVKIFRNQLVVICGRSGSGKSSLAIDTIFAEGQRQFLECQSLNTRQFFDQLPKADVDLVAGLPPTVCSTQQTAGGNPRSTVGTLTEIHDFLKVLMSQVGTVHCYQCGDAIEQKTQINICENIESLPEATRLMILAPIVDEYATLETAVEKIRREGLLKICIDGAVFDIEQTPAIDPDSAHQFAAVVDRIIIRDGSRERLQKAIETADEIGQGNVVVSYATPEEIEADSTLKSDFTRWNEDRFSTRYACSKCNITYAEVSPRLFSFNGPQGACPDCQGLGLQLQFQVERLFDKSLSLSDGAIQPWQQLTVSQRKSKLTELKPILKALSWSADQPLDRMPAKDWESLLNSADPKSLGIFNLICRDIATTDDDDWYETLSSYERELPCSGCNGSRLNAQANSVFYQGKNIREILATPLDLLTGWFRTFHCPDKTDSDRTIETVASEAIVSEILKRLDYLLEVGVHYLTLGRGADSLSGGELQRVRMGASIGSGLANVCYVLDEPTVGLHARDSHRLLSALSQLQGNGNSLIVVEHDEVLIRAADQVIDIGPGAGELGGQVVAAGSPTEIAAQPASPTGNYLSGATSIPVPERREVNLKTSIQIKGASGFNLKSVDVTIPLHRFVCVTGVSGSGKSTLINRTLAPTLQDHFGFFGRRPEPHDSIHGMEAIDKAILIDQKPIGRSAKSCPATFTGVFDQFRKIFSATRIAKQRGYGIGRFSFNSRAGRCENCLGHGIQKVKMDFMPDMMVECETCHGQRFNVQTLQAKFGSLSIADVLQLTVSQARERFENIEKITKVLDVLISVGLGYLKLGQSATTLSGGEAQRLKLARELSRTAEAHTLYLLDEPTRGLHFDDVKDLMAVLQKLVDQNHSVVVIEHNLDVIKCADWVIDLGPDGGRAGGEIVVAGTPETVAQCDHSITGRFLRETL